MEENQSRRSGAIEVELRESPTEQDWMQVKARALITIWKRPVHPPSLEWKHAILLARHSPIRRLFFSFLILCPYYVSVHLCRHIHAQPYVSSQRNDRQNVYDRLSAPQSAPVMMIWDMNAEELMEVCNKRLCYKASEETREVAARMARLVLDKYPEFDGLLEPMCVRLGGVCPEMSPCGKLGGGGR